MRVVRTHTSHVCMRVAAADTPEHCRHRWCNLKQQCGELITSPAAESPPACLLFSNRKGCGGAQVLCPRVLAMQQQTRGETRCTSHPSIQFQYLLQSWFWRSGGAAFSCRGPQAGLPVHCGATTTGSRTDI